MEDGKLERMAEDKISRQVRRHLERKGSSIDAEREVASMMAKRQERDTRKDASVARGRRNIYTCDTCFGHVVTVDTCEGTTPFLVECHSTPGCRGMMQSSMYRVFDQSMRPDYEWYLPTKEETVALSAGLREHVSKGGLVMRKAS